MLHIQVGDDGTVHLAGRLDAAQAEHARSVFLDVRSSCTVNFSDLDYISSAGLGVLLEAQQRLNSRGHALRLTRMNRHTRLVFELAGFDAIFEID